MNEQVTVALSPLLRVFINYYGGTIGIDRADHSGQPHSSTDSREVNSS